MKKRLMSLLLTVALFMNTVTTEICAFAEKRTMLTEKWQCFSYKLPTGYSLISKDMLREKYAGADGSVVYVHFVDLPKIGLCVSDPQLFLEFIDSSAAAGETAECFAEGSLDGAKYRISTLEGEHKAYLYVVKDAFLIMFLLESTECRAADALMAIFREMAVEECGLEEADREQMPEFSASSTLWRCGICGAVNNICDSSFCRDCGAGKNAVYWICGNGHENSAKDRFCAECGSKPGEKRWTCFNGHINGERDSFCVICGERHR